MKIWKLNKSTIFILKLYLIPIFIVVFYADTSAQSDYRPGYILKTKTDTVFGYINNNSYLSNSQYCEFKKTLKDKPTKYSPKELYGFRFSSGKYYVSKEIKQNELTKTVFLEILIDGELDIFFLKGKQGEQYFVERKSEPIQELTYSERTEWKDGKRVKIESKKFAGLLTYLTREYPELKTKISTIKKPNRSEFVQVAKKYHDYVCDDYSCIIYEKDAKKKTLIEASLDYYFYTPKKITEFGEKTFWTPGIGFNYYTQQLSRSERIFFGTGFFYEFDSFDGQGYRRGKPRIRIPVSINYFHPTKKFSPVFSMALDVNRFLYTQSYRAGLRVKFNRFSLIAYSQVQAALFVKLYGTAQSIGLQYELH